MEVPVAVILPTAEVGGHERMLIEWLARARDFGLRPTVYCRASRELGGLIEQAGLPWVEAPYAVHRRGFLRSARWRNFICTVRTAARAPRDTPLLLAPGAMQLAVLQILACTLARRAIACYVPMTHDAATLRLGMPALRDWLTTRLASRVRMWITISEAQGRNLPSYWRVHAPVHIVPNRLRAMSARPKPPAPCAPSPQGLLPLSVVYLGRFNPIQKGLDWLVTVLREEPEWASGYTFTFQGRGSFLGPLEALARQLGPMRVRVVPWGHASDALATADVLILASRFEGLPLVAIEAIWTGVPVVATVESGLGDVLEEACLFPFGDLVGLRTALDRMRSRAAREDAVAHARARLDQLLSEEHFRASVRGVVDGLETLRSGKRLVARVG